MEERPERKSVGEKVLTSKAVRRTTRQVIKGGRAIKDSRPGQVTRQHVQSATNSRPVASVKRRYDKAWNALTQEEQTAKVMDLLEDLTLVAAMQHAEISDLKARIATLESVAPVR